MPINRFLLDGQKYKEGSLEEGATLAQFLCVEANTLIGFTTEDKLLSYVDSKGAKLEVEKMLGSARSARKHISTLTDAEIAKEEAVQIDTVRRANVKVASVLRANGVFPYEERKLLQLAKNQMIESAILYDSKCTKGSWIYLPEGLWYKLGKFGFNDKTESVLNLSLHWIVLYQHTYFHGQELWLRPGTTCDLGWFNNRASSAII